MRIDMAEQGTGKHPHKISEEPWHHTQGSESERRESRSGSEPERRSASNERGHEEEERSARGREESESRDLKEREYQDSEGNIHHHTHTSKAMKEKE
jgi:hypothetical protein